MYRYAEITSLLFPLQELQDRVSLESPGKFRPKEEGFRESADQQVAHYSIVYYRTIDGEPGSSEVNAEPILERLAEDVFSEYDVDWDIQHSDRSRDTRETVVTVTWLEGSPREAALRVADAPYDVFPLTIYADQDVYNVATDGNQFLVLKNGEPVVNDAPSPAYALGSLVSILREELDTIEATSGVPNSPPNDFLAAMAMSVVDTPDLPDEAKEHFVKFYELVTLKDFEAAREPAELYED